MLVLFLKPIVVLPFNTILTTGIIMILATAHVDADTKPIYDLVNLQSAVIGELGEILFSYVLLGCLLSLQ